MFKKYKKFIIILILAYGFIFYVLGYFTGWLNIKAGIDKFPDINKEDKILILAPHIDDEAISSAGLIQRAIKTGAKVKIVFLTNGDFNITSYFKNNKETKFKPEKFIELGEKRMEEGRKAMKILGLKNEDLIFLGYPDGGLIQMFSENYFKNNPYTSKSTKLKFNPYKGSYKTLRKYSGINLVEDLGEIILSYQPNIIIVPQPKDLHPDHKATFYFLEKTLNIYKNKLNYQPRVFTYLVHYKSYPEKGSYKSFLYPPKNLFTKTGWYSFELSDDEILRKIYALKEYKTQVFQTFPEINFLFKFVRENEIFEEY